ncbi:MAG: response regulator [Burkholderiales bacterium]|nr:response regulator [Burkholderiales bacterium]
MTALARILLVEDNPHDAELTLKALSGMANEVLHLWDGADALDYLYRRGEFAGRPEGHPAVVLLDLKMPRVDGLEVLRQVKGDPALKKIPVVVMTSSREDQDLNTCYDLSINAYVVKPVKFQEFVGAVKQVGAFWAVLNELPPGSVSRRDPRGA